MTSLVLYPLLVIGAFHGPLATFCVDVVGYVRHYFYPVSTLLPAGIRLGTAVVDI
jgi:hypothetical protein